MKVQTYFDMQYVWNFVSKIKSRHGSVLFCKTELPLSRAVIKPRLLTFSCTAPQANFLNRWKMFLNLSFIIYKLQTYGCKWDICNMSSINFYQYTLKKIFFLLEYVLIANTILMFNSKCDLLFFFYYYYLWNFLPIFKSNVF